MFTCDAYLFLLFVSEADLIALQVKIIEEKLKDDIDSVSILCTAIVVSALFSWFNLYLMNNIISNIVNTDSTCAQIISLIATLILIVLAHIIARVYVRVAIVNNPFYTINQQLHELSNKAQEIQLKIDDAEEQQEEIKKLLENNEESIDRYKKSAQKAISSNDESKARYFLEQKQQLERANAYLEKAYTPAYEKLVQMKEVYTRLTDEISLLETHRKIIEVSSSTDEAQTDELILDDVENNARRILDEAQAMAELEIGFPDETEMLAKQYKD